MYLGSFITCGADLEILDCHFNASNRIGWNREKSLRPCGRAVSSGHSVGRPWDHSIQWGRLEEAPEGWQACAYMSCTQGFLLAVGIE